MWRNKGPIYRITVIFVVMIILGASFFTPWIINYKGDSWVIWVVLGVYLALFIGVILYSEIHHHLKKKKNETK